METQTTGREKSAYLDSADVLKKKREQEKNEHIVSWERGSYDKIKWDKIKKIKN